MIKKFVKIRGVGKFEDYSSTGDVELKNITLVYAENGQGKTTLTNIIRSLSSGDSDSILKRKTIGRNDQLIQILVDGSMHIFDNGQWKNKSQCQAEIFDIFFVNNNVFSGFDFSLDHGKNLHKFVMGEEGVQLAQKIKSLKEEIVAQNKDLKDLEQSIQSQIGKYSFKEFLRIPFDKDAEAKTNRLKQEIETAKQYEKLFAVAELTELPKIEIPVKAETIISVVSQSLQSISEAFLEKVEGQKIKLIRKGLSDPEKWISHGFRSIDLESDVENNCPFCDQPLNDEKSILSAYIHYFNKEYIELLDKTQQIDLDLENSNISQGFFDLQNKVSTNNQLIGYWKDHIDISNTTIDFNEHLIKLEEALGCTKNIIKIKLANVLKPLELDNLNLLIECQNRANQEIYAYNSFVKSTNGLIKKLKNFPNDLAALNEALEPQLLHKKRFIDLKEAYKDYIALCECIEESNKEKNKLQQQLSEQTKKFYSEYGPKINSYLNILIPNDSYQLENVTSTYSGTSKEPALQYVLTLKGCPITFSESLQHPCFKHTLSEGDKSALAFAFFLAKLDMQDISDKIVVFDDPISSFDKNRRKRTITAIKSLFGRAKQVITLSHNETFIYDLYETTNSQSLKALRIVYGGKIESFDSIEEEMQSDYFKSLKAFDNFIDNPQRDKVIEVRGSIRIVLENNLKFRFHKYLNQQYTRKDGTVVGPHTSKNGLGNIIDILEVSDCTFKEDKVKVISGLRELNQVSMSDHHGTIERDHRTEPMTVYEIGGYIKDTLEMIYKTI